MIITISTNIAYILFVFNVSWSDSFCDKNIILFTFAATLSLLSGQVCRWFNALSLAGIKYRTHYIIYTFTIKIFGSSYVFLYSIFLWYWWAFGRVGQVGHLTWQPTVCDCRHPWTSLTKKSQGRCRTSSSYFSSPDQGKKGSGFGGTLIAIYEASLSLIFILHLLYWATF